MPERLVAPSPEETEGSPTGEARLEPPRPPKKYRVGIVSVDEMVKSHARDAASAKLTEVQKDSVGPRLFRGEGRTSKQQLKGFANLLRNTWKHNLFKAYYHQKEVVANTQKILAGEGNIYGAEGIDQASHDEAMQNVVENFTSAEYDQLVHKEAGEKHEFLGDTGQELEVKEEIRQLIRDYVTGALDDTTFGEARNRALSGISAARRDVVGKGLLYADNLLEIAKQVKQNIEHGAGLTELDTDFEVVIGSAKGDVRTEAQYTAVDRIVDKLEKIPGGKFVNETTVALLYAGTVGSFHGATRGLARTALSLGGSAVVAAFTAGWREGKMVSDDRRQNQREIAQGKKFDPSKSPRRVEMQEVAYEMKSATELADNLEQTLFEIREGVRQPKDLSQEEFNQALARLAEIDSRVKLSDREKKDLISYSHVSKVVQERKRLDKLRAEAKIHLMKLLRGEIKTIVPGRDFTYRIPGLTETAEIEDFLTHNPGYLTETDPAQKNDLVSYWLMERRMATGYTVPEIEAHHGSMTPAAAREYAGWDHARMEEVVRDWRARRPAEEKVLGRDLRLPDGRPLSEFIASLACTRALELLKGDGGIEKRDAVFQKMRRKKMMQAAWRGLWTGAVVGTVAQEVGAFFRSGQEGLAEGLIKDHQETATGTPIHLTALDSLRHWLAGDLPKFGGNLHETHIGNHYYELPEGVDLTQNPDQTMNLIGPDGPLAEHIPVDSAGNLDQSVLNAHGIHSVTSVDGITRPGTGPGAGAAGGPNPLAGPNEISRHLWLDNNTPMHLDPASGKLLGADYNELKLQWGEEGIGVNANGDYVMSAGRMTPDGSFHQTFSTDAQADLKAGNLKLLLSASQATQKQVWEFLANDQGNIVIPKDSDAAQQLFHVDASGHAVFDGRFAEIGKVIESDKPGEHFWLLATHEGKGIEAPPPAPPIVPIVDQVPTTVIDVPNYRIDVPFIFPFGWRTPLEPGEFPPPGYYGTSNPEQLAAEFERRGLPLDSYYARTETVNGEKRIVWVDKDGQPVRRDVKREKRRLKNYLEQQDEHYLKWLKEQSRTIAPMSNKCRVAVNIPARFETVNLANLLDQYAKQVDAGGSPIDPELYEINIIVNRKQSETPDNSLEVVANWKRQHPGLRVNVLDVAYEDSRACVGLARKQITDLTLLRSTERDGTLGPLYIESEDADLFSVDSRAISKLIAGFDAKPEVDTLRGLQDRQPEILQKNDLLFFDKRLFDFVEILGRSHRLRPENNPEANFSWNRIFTGGWNTAYTAEAYAQIGGYDSRMRVGEDMNIGEKISILRGHRDTASSKFIYNINTAKASGLRSNSSPRRFIQSLARSVNPYDEKEFEDQSLKHMTLDQLLDQISAYEKADMSQLSRYEKVLNNALIWFRNVRMNPDAAKYLVRRVLTYIGLKKGDYEFQAERITLTPRGMQRIIENQNRYREEERWKWGYRRQSSPYDMDNSLEEVVGEESPSRRSRLETAPGIIAQAVSDAADAPLAEKKRLVSGEANEVYAVKTVNNRELVARISRWENPRFEDEKWALDKVRQKGVPTPEILSAKEYKSGGETLTICLENKLPGKSLREMLESGQLSDAEKRALTREAGAALSRIHSVEAPGFGMTDKDGGGPHSSWEEFMRQFEPQESMLAALGANIGLPESAITKAIQMIRSSSDLYQGVESRLLHGDWSTSHLLVDNGHVSGVLDFQNFLGGDPVYDLAYWSLYQKDKLPTDWLVEGYAGTLNRKDEKMEVYQLHLALVLLKYFSESKNRSGLEMIKNKILKIVGAEEPAAETQIPENVQVGEN